VDRYSGYSSFEILVETVALPPKNPSQVWIGFQISFVLLIMLFIAEDSHDGRRPNPLRWAESDDCLGFRFRHGGDVFLVITDKFMSRKNQMI